MTTPAEALQQTVVEGLGADLRTSEVFRGLAWIEVAPEALTRVCLRLRDSAELAFTRLAALTAVDHWPAEPRFEMVYQLYSFSHHAFLGLRTFVAGETAALDSLEPLYPNAVWHEREVLDMFGIRFHGLSDPRRILMPADWVGHPLRKDYPLGYEEVQFSFNAREIDRRKPYATE
ncbi:MAG: NADH-quinone oxidoreductase subunit C [Anaerolineales bacterium]